MGVVLLQKKPIAAPEGKSRRPWNSVALVIVNVWCCYSYLVERKRGDRGHTAIDNKQTRELLLMLELFGRAFCVRNKRLRNGFGNESSLQI